MAHVLGDLDRDYVASTDKAAKYWKTASLIAFRPRVVVVGIVGRSRLDHLCSVALVAIGYWRMQ